MNKWRERRIEKKAATSPRARSVADDGRMSVAEASTRGLPDDHARAPGAGGNMDGDAVVIGEGPTSLMIRCGTAVLELGAFLPQQGAGRLTALRK